VRYVVVRACRICPVRRALGAHVATEFRWYPDVHVVKRSGGLGELSVTVDGQSAFRSRGILSFPNLQKVIRQVRLALTALPPS
jgi:hypothetical protein